MFSFPDNYRWRTARRRHQRGTPTIPWPRTNGPGVRKRSELFALVRRTLHFCALFLRLKIVPGCNEMSAMVSGCTMSNWQQFAKHGNKPSCSEAGQHHCQPARLNDGSLRRRHARPRRATRCEKRATKSPRKPKAKKPPTCCRHALSEVLEFVPVSATLGHPIRERQWRADRSSALQCGLFSRLGVVFVGEWLLCR